MLPITALLLTSTTAGTAITAASRALHRRRAQQQSRGTDLSSDVNQEIISNAAIQEEINHYFTANSLGFGMTMAGLVFPPLMIASVPVTIYTSLPALQGAVRAWQQEKRINSKTMETVLVASTLATSNFLPAAAVGWMYSFGRKFKSQVRGDLRDLVKRTAQAPKIWTEFNGAQMQVPLDAIENGDIIIMRENSILPLPGRVSKGSAILNTYFSTLRVEPVHVEVGDLVPPLAVIMEGQIHIQVTK